jgi:hypothetical protein
MTKQDYIQVQSVTATHDNILQPNTFYLYPNYPNPFNPSTIIEYYLPRVSDVSISIYNMIGQEVMTYVFGKQGPGVHMMQWDGRDSRGIPQPSGIYIYRIIAGKFIAERRMFMQK